MLQLTGGSQLLQLSRHMDLSEFTANYAQSGDEELLCLWVDRTHLVPEAVIALDREIQRRGLKKQNATRVKKRLVELAARDAKGTLASQVAVAKYERNMRHFVGWEEPEFVSPFGSRDIRRTFASVRHKYRVWKAFRDHTGHWPVFSMWFYFLSWLTVIGVSIAAFVWVSGRPGGSNWNTLAAIGIVLLLLGARALGARLARRLDWKRYGT